MRSSFFSSSLYRLRIFITFSALIFLVQAPAMAQSGLSLGSELFTGNGFAFVITGTNSISVAVEASTDLVNWTTLNQVTLTNGSYTFVDTAATGLTSRFYAVKNGSLCSSNIIGFTHTTIPAGGSAIIANQLNNPVGNSLNVLFPSVPNGTVLQKFDPATSFTSYNYLGGWGSSSNVTLNPGESAFLTNPSDDTDLIISFIGNVPQSTGLVNYGIANTVNTYTLISSILPVVANLTDQSFPILNGDSVRRFDPASQAYVNYTYSSGAWSPSVPILDVGEGFFFKTGTATNRNWTENFSAAPPSITLTSPNSASYYIQSNSLSLSVTGNASAGVSQVDYYNGSTNIGTSSASPYSYTWTNPPTGINTLSAKVTDNYGQTAVSLPAKINVLPYAEYADRVVTITTEVQSSPAQIVLHFGAVSGTMPSGYSNVTTTIYRRSKGAVSWGSSIVSGYAGDDYTDSESGVIVSGCSFEYQIVRTYTGSGQTDATVTGYIYAGIQTQFTDYRGKMILLVDNTMSSNLTSQLSRLESDLTGDGWIVLRHDISRGPEPRNSDGSFNTSWTVSNAFAVKELRSIIEADYYSDPSNVKSVFLLGHLAVPYSGGLDPDGHLEHYGAWPVDGFYSDVTSLYNSSGWTDISVDTTSDAVQPERAENANVPFDGKFDQFAFPAPPLLQVGRVDLYGMQSFNDTNYTSNPLTETELLSQYLDKNHNFRSKNFKVQKRALLESNLSSDGPIPDLDPFSGIYNEEWNALNPLFGNQIFVPDINVSYMQWFPYLSQDDGDYLWACGTGYGGYQTAQGVGETYYADFGGCCPDTYGYYGLPVPSGKTMQSFAALPSKAVFTALYGSFFGDWDNTNNLLRAPLANSGYGLTCVWVGGAADAYFMGLGETIGYSVLRYWNSGGGVEVGLMGDPSLRLDIVAPVSNLTITNGGSSVTVKWNRSPDDTGDSGDNFQGYNVYRAATAKGPFTLLSTNSPVSDTDQTHAQLTYSAPADTSEAYTAYMVRAVKLETSSSGTYFNASEGLIDDISGSTVIAPQIISGPGNQIVRTGYPIALSVSVSGTPSFTYQWQKGTNVLIGETGSILVFTNASTTNEDVYTVTISNSAGSVSATAYLIPPIATNDIIYSTAKITTNLDVLANDFDAVPGSSLTIASISPIDSRAGSMTIISNGTLIHYVPATDWYGPVIFQYVVTDGTITDTATATLNVMPDLSNFPVPIHGTNGETVEVLASEDLNTWASLGNVTMTGISTNFSDSTSVDYSNRFYMIRHSGYCETWGFVKITAPPGYSLIANQLNNPAGNSLDVLFPNATSGSTVTILNSNGFSTGNYFLTNWANTFALMPGSGAMLYNASSADLPIVFAGSLPFGGLITNNISSGYQYCGSVLPKQQPISSLGFPLSNGDIFYRFSPLSGFVGYNYLGGWDPAGEPTMNIGEGFELYSPTNAGWVETAPGCLPSVSITAPSNASIFFAPASIILTATASAPSGIAEVDFYQGTTLIGSVASSPYTLTWSGMAAGSYSLTAKVTDINGMAVISIPINITVTP